MEGMGRSCACSLAMANLSEISSPHQGQLNWYALYTNSNQEKRVAERLDRQGIEFYLPLYRTVRRRSDRRVTLSLPLFPGYLFVHISLQDRRRVLETPRVAWLVGSGSLPSPLPEEEVSILRRGLTGSVHAEPYKYLTEGCRVRIVNGPFEGIEGILVEHKQSCRVAVSIQAIMRSFVIEVGIGDVERI